MDHFAFASLAQIKILLVPVGSIKKSLFDKRAAEIRSFDSIPMGDIAVGDKDQRGLQRAFVPRGTRSHPIYFQLVFFPQPTLWLQVVFTSVSHHILPPNPTSPCRSSDPPRFRWVSSESPHVQLRASNTPWRILMMLCVMSSRLTMPCLCPECVLRSKTPVTMSR